MRTRKNYYLTLLLKSLRKLNLPSVLGVLKVNLEFCKLERSQTGNPSSKIVKYSSFDNRRLLFFAEGDGIETTWTSKSNSLRV